MRHLGLQSEAEGSPCVVVKREVGCASRQRTERTPIRPKPLCPECRCGGGDGRSLMRIRQRRIPRQRGAVGGRTGGSGPEAGAMAFVPRVNGGST